jgi:hypothetical protein
MVIEKYIFFVEKEMTFSVARNPRSSPRSRALLSLDFNCSSTVKSTLRRYASDYFGWTILISLAITFIRENLPGKHICQYIFPVPC